MSDPDVELGATGRFPDGKVGPDDEGELMVAVSTAGDRLRIDFGPKPVAWVSLTADQALGFASVLGRSRGGAQNAGEGGVIVACGRCGGDGVLLHEIGFDRTTGAVMEMVERCPECGGSGCDWIEGEPLAEADVAEWTGEGKA